MAHTAADVEQGAFSSENVSCELCGAATNYTGTKRCNRCWELERRIERDPELARKILARIAAVLTLAVVLGAPSVAVAAIGGKYTPGSADYQPPGYRAPQAKYQWTRSPATIIKHANTPDWGYRGYSGLRGYRGVVTGGDHPSYRSR